jgi:UDP-N-acetylmuramoyl-tripeptide--D-alanyl-D-alanine ligase
VIKGKTELYQHIGEHQGHLFVASSSEILMTKAQGYLPAGHITTYGTGPSDYVSGSVIAGGELLSIELWDGTIIHTQLVGAYNFDNVMAAICIGRYFGVAITAIKVAIEGYSPTNNRSQLITRGTNTIILDAYNANPSSMAEALKNFNLLVGDDKIAILGEMMEMGEYSEAEHQKMIDLLATMPLSHRVLVGRGFHRVQGREGFLYFETTALLRDWYLSQQFENMLILIKGSRSNGLEKILE